MPEDLLAPLGLPWVWLLLRLPEAKSFKLFSWWLGIWRGEYNGPPDGPSKSGGGIPESSKGNPGKPDSCASWSETSLDRLSFSSDVFSSDLFDLLLETRMALSSKAALSIWVAKWCARDIWGCCWFSCCSCLAIVISSPGTGIPIGMLLTLCTDPDDMGIITVWGCCCWRDWPEKTSEAEDCICCIKGVWGETTVPLFRWYIFWWLFGCFIILEGCCWGIGWSLSIRTGCLGWLKTAFEGGVARCFWPEILPPKAPLMELLCWVCCWGWTRTWWRGIPAAGKLLLPLPWYCSCWFDCCCSTDCLRLLTVREEPIADTSPVDGSCWYSTRGKLPWLYL